MGGIDTALYSGNRSDYSAVQNGDGSLSLSDIRAGAPDGTDNLKNVELFKFADGTLTLAELLPPLEAPRTVYGTIRPDSFTDAPGFATTYWADTGNDSVSGLDGSDELHGGNGNDVLSGGTGADRLYGDNGDDRLDGGPGSDLLAGGRGNDWLIGGSGADTFAFAKDGGADVVADFAVGLDHLQLDEGLTVKSAASTDFDHAGGADLVLQLSSGSVTLLNVGPVADWHALL